MKKKKPKDDLSTMKSRPGWHFIYSNMRLAHADERRVRVGSWVKMNPVIQHNFMWSSDPHQNDGPCINNPSLCRAGMHASTKIMDAIRYSSNGKRILCRVEIKGGIDSGQDKFCGRYRKILQKCDPTESFIKFSMKVLREFGRRCGLAASSIRMKAASPTRRTFPSGHMAYSSAEGLMMSGDGIDMVRHAIGMLKDVGLSNDAIEARLRRAVKGVLK